MKKKKILVCVGTAIVDCIINGYNNSTLSGKNYFADAVNLMPGGEGLNEAVTAQKLGMDVRLVCGIGDDPAAAILMSEIIGNGLSTEWIVRKEGFRTPVTVMFIGEGGDRKSITNMAHRFNWHPEEDLSYLEGADAISFDSLFRVPFNDPDIIFRMVSEAKKRGLAVYADTKIPNYNILTLDDLRDSLPLIDYIFPNEVEAAYYTGQTDPEAMADVFLAHGVRNAVIKLGSKGCLLKNQKETIRLENFQVDAVDATGAGDNFIVGFITVKNEGGSDRDALLFANACGAVSTTKVGGTVAVRSREQIEEFLRENDCFSGKHQR